MSSLFLGKFEKNGIDILGLSLLDLELEQVGLGTTGGSGILTLGHVKLGTALVQFVNQLGALALVVARSLQAVCVSG
jgi:hypothetical protein